jgi:hypothetical protein
VVIQGWCPICERRWKIALGQMCPKHEVPLEQQARTDQDEGREPISRWVTVGTFMDDASARARRLRLELEDIPTQLEIERMGSRSMFTVATGGVSLDVPQEHLADARVIMAQDWTIPEGELQDDGDDQEEGAASDASRDRRGRVMKAIVWFMVAPSIIGFVVGILGLVVVLILGLAGYFNR